MTASAVRSDEQTAGPLSHLRVIELGNFIAAPFAGKVFAEFGADVIKVEQPATGDELRGWRATPGETSMMFRAIGRNKRSVTIDLHRPEGQELVRGLIATCDVVLENFRPGTLERWNLGPEIIADINPGAVLVRISGYGQSGPYSPRAGFGSAAEAFGGLRYVTGTPDREPARSGASIGDVAAGMYGVIGALVTLLGARAGEGGEGPLPVVDVALYEAVFSLLDGILPEYDAHGIVRERSGGKLPGVVPSDAYLCKDGKPIIIGGNSVRVFARLMKAIGRPDLAEDPDLQDGPGRAQRAEELEAALTEWARTVTMKEAHETLASAGVPVDGVLSISDIVEDAHYRARRMLVPRQVRIGDELKEIRFPGVVPKIEGTPEMRWPGPDLGQHTSEVLGDLLGITPSEEQKLREGGIV